MEAGTINNYERRNTPLDGGYGTDIDELARDMAMTKAKEEALVRADIQPGSKVRFLTTVPYSGGEPLVEVTLRESTEDFPNYPA